MKEIKKKGVATSLVPAATCWPLASLVPRRHVLSVGTCSPSARALRRHLFSVGTCSPCSHVHFSEKHLTLSWHRFHSLSTRTHTRPWRCFHSLFFPHTHRNLFERFLHGLDRSTSAQLRVPPSSGASHPLSANRGETRLLPSASPVTVTGRFLYAPGGCAAVFLSCTQPP